mgnify:FL=1
MSLRCTIIIIVVALALIIAGAAIWLVSKAASAYEGGETVRIYVPASVSPESLRDSLVSRLGGFGDDVYDLWRLQRSSAARARGSYAIDPGETALTLSRRLRSGRQNPVRLTFNNVRTLDELARRLADRMEWGTSDFLAACDSVLKPRGFKFPEQYPAAFIPDTYEFYWTTSARDVVSRLADYRDRFWNDERRSAAAAFGLTPVGVATIASIVEEETAKADERPTVARLYLNRLSRHMPLQADPTVKFAVGDFSLRRIRSRHLEIDSPYNTYRRTGLPPGPIRIADSRTIDAVLNAPSHNYIFMCARPDFSGYHNFAADAASHSRNAAAYHRALNSRGVR